MSFFTKSESLSELGFRKSHLKELMRKAYDAGFLPSIEWRQAEIFINKLETIKQVDSQIGHYTRLIESKQTSKAA